MKFTAWTILLSLSFFVTGCSDNTVPEADIAGEDLDAAIDDGAELEAEQELADESE